MYVGEMGGKNKYIQLLSFFSIRNQSGSDLSAHYVIRTLRPFLPT